MMKKTTSALAIAALLGSGAATAATFQIDDDTTFGVSGRVSPFYADTEVEAEDSDGDGTGVVESESTYGDTSRVIFSGNHTLDNGLTGFVNYELRNLGNTSNDGKSDLEVEARSAFTGVEGNDFGRLSFGRQITTYQKAVGGYSDVAYFSGGLTLTPNTTENRSLQYTTPSFNGVTVHAGAQVNGDDVKADENDSSSSLSGAIVFDGPGFTLSAAFDQAEYLGRAEDDSGATNADDIAADTSDEPIFGLAAETQMAGLDVAAWYSVDGSQDESDEVDIMGLSLGYGTGNFSGLAVVQSVDSNVEELNLANKKVTDPGSRTEVYLQGVYSLSDQFNLIGEYVQKDQEEDLDDGITLGAIYNF